MKETGSCSLYFHIPFCTKKCPYCHFYVLPDQEPLKKLLLAALYDEWRLRLPQLGNRRLLSIYFGGGTPYLFGPEAIATVLSWIEPLSDVEITLEANPEEVTLEKMRAYKACGINRVSMGVQSLDESSLSVLGRGHSAHQAIQAIETIRRSGIENISIDLIYDLPYQTLSSWHATLAAACHLPITHLSLYNLTFEPKTLFFKERKKLQPHTPEPTTSLRMLQDAVRAFENAGFSRYEISAFAQPGFHSIHNTGYWTGREFLGFGPSAFSYWDKKRFANVAHLKTYSEKLKNGLLPLDFEEELPYPHDQCELLAVGLRLSQGVDLKRFQLPPSTLESLKMLEKKGWLTLSNHHALLTEEGKLFYDSVATELIHQPYIS